MVGVCVFIVFVIISVDTSIGFGVEYTGGVVDFGGVVDEGNKFTVVGVSIMDVN